MRITIIGIGTRGDVQPLVALARGLAARGHSVKAGQLRGVCGAERRSRDLEFVPLGGDIAAAMKTVVGADLAAAGRNPFAATSVFREIIDRNIVGWTRTMRAAAADSDIIVDGGNRGVFRPRPGPGAAGAAGPGLSSTGAAELGGGKPAVSAISALAAGLSASRPVRRRRSTALAGSAAGHRAQRARALRGLLGAAAGPAQGNTACRPDHPSRL